MDWIRCNNHKYGYISKTERDLESETSTKDKRSREQREPLL